MTCPNCGKTYEPTYATEEDAPGGTIAKEQNLTGICSDGCWTEWLAGAG